MSLPRILKWIYQRRRLISLIDVLPGPPALPIVGCAYRFSFDSYILKYLLNIIC
uniref:Uncharacterized protein n=1 Tax=Heterorhabditis bacteriophora TaxID=37862 RepID=A0A1I7WVB2_HETBA